MFNLNFLTRFVTRDLKPLGRWNVVYCSRAIDTKVTMTNEDHCGSCGSTPVARRLDKQKLAEQNRVKIQSWVDTVKAK
jgi:hypothetical protein